MARSAKTALLAEEVQPVATTLPKMEIRRFSFWIVGDTPIICHAWSEKARRQMLSKQLKEVSEGRSVRDPVADFVNSLYEMGEGRYGFPATAVKKCLLSVAHKDRGVPRATVMAALYINAELVRTRPALAGAVCDMPLLQIHGAEPVMREDMVRVGSGLNKTADLAYRAQIFPWALRVTGKLNTGLCPAEWLPFLAQHSGLATGLGDWRNEKSGMFGSFHPANTEETMAWDDFAKGAGPLPEPVAFDEAAE
jgi:hypothetical protein